MRKKKILVHSNYCRAFTGFGKHKKNILRYLFNTGKYEIIELANGRAANDPILKLLPWEAAGSLPTDRTVLAQLSRDQQASRLAGYGYFGIDEAMEKYRPDVYIGIEDIWGLEFQSKKWWDIVSPVVWTTLDSLPILPQAEEIAKKSKNFYVWASFAEKAMKQQFPHVKTLHGSIDTSTFFPLSDEEKMKLRLRNRIAPDEFIIGFVFRNQLRKSVPNLLDGFMEFRRQNPQAKARLLLHTHWAEGWDIPRMLKEKNIPQELVLTTYFCDKCGQYEVKPFSGEKLDCRCGAKQSQETTNIRKGVNEIQLNEIYNMMDVYCHPFTSGGQEIPIQEAKLCELITLVTNYSCGEDHCTPQSGGFPLDWTEYREPGTQFIKATTSAFSISKQLKKVWNMQPSKRKQLGKKARKFVVENYSIEAVGKQLEQIIDEFPLVEDEKWEKAEEEKEKILTILDFLDDEDKGRRLLVALPQGLPDVVLANSLLTNLKNKYPDFNIYFATEPQFFGAVDGHPAIHKMLPYHPAFENVLEMEGTAEKEGLFDIVFLPHITTHLNPCFMHNNKDK